MGTNRDSTYDRPNNYGNVQQQNYSPDRTRNFDQQPQDYHQNEYSGSQESGYNKEPPNNQEEVQMGSSNAGTSTINQNSPRQQTNVGKNYNNINKYPTIGTPKTNSAPTKMPVQVKKTSTSQNPTVNNIQEMKKNNLSNSDTDSGDVLPSKLNNSNIETKNVPEEVSKNNIKIKNKGEVKNVVKTKGKNVLKPITKRKFFFQAKPVLPNRNISIDKETIFYVD
ncbi:unnamed protein product, partial [Brenthis ino]